MKELLIPILISMLACNESRIPDTTLLGYDYYPINIGEYRIYEVEEILFRLAGFDTTNYQLKETIYDSIVSANQVKYLIRQETRQNSLQEWSRDSIWSVSQSPTYLSINENGTPFIKLTFPVHAGSQWDGNALNTRKKLIYYYENLSKPIIDTLALSDHIRIIIKDIKANITGVDLKSEVYARSIGLIEKDYLTQTNCTASSCGEKLGQVIAGRSLKQKLIEVGNE